MGTSPTSPDDPKDGSPKRKKKLIRLKQLLHKPSQLQKKPGKDVKRTESMPISRRKHSDSTGSECHGRPEHWWRGALLTV